VSRRNTLHLFFCLRICYQCMHFVVSDFGSVMTICCRILKCIIRTGRLQKKDVHLVASVVRDAEKLQWRPGQLERRKRAIQAVLSSGPGAWLDESVDDDMLRREIKSDNALFKRKGWNEVDSGFRLWGGGKMDIKAADEKSHDGVDDFLQSKGWNNVESGFRII